jgi:hypothetical protein
MRVYSVHHPEDTPRLTGLVDWVGFGISWSLCRKSRWRQGTEQMERAQLSDPGLPRLRAVFGRLTRSYDVSPGLVSGPWSA